MLASQGNTGIYILYGYVRIASLFGKSGLDREELAQSPGSIALSHELERELLMQIVSFPELFSGYEEELTSHIICHYLYELAGCYSRFWKECPILTAAEDIRRTPVDIKPGGGRAAETGSVPAGHRRGREDVTLMALGTDFKSVPGCICLSIYI